jgi:hypothetical protein
MAGETNGTISVRTNRGDDDFKVEFNSDGNIATKDFELSIRIKRPSGQLEPQMIEAALSRFRDWFTSNQKLWRGL